jgi:UDP-glucose 4-epimerase
VIAQSPKTKPSTNRFLVTGGAGFIGSHLVDSLVGQGREVIVLDNFRSGKRKNLNSKAKLIEGDLLDQQLLSSIVDQGLDGCFHLAARPIIHDTIHHWRACTEANLLGTVNLFQALTENASRSIPVAYASSCAVYGSSGIKNRPIKETDPLDPQSPYAVDKLACEHHAIAGGKCRGLHSIGARFFNVFGERQDPNSAYSGVVSKFQKNIAAQKPITIYGDGEQTRDFIHVSNIVDLLIQALPSASPEAPVINFGTGTAITVSKLAQTLMEAFETQVPIEFKQAREGEVRYSQADVSKLISKTGYRPEKPYLFF